MSIDLATVCRIAIHAIEGCVNDQCPNSEELVAHSRKNQMKRTQDAVRFAIFACDPSHLRAARTPDAA